MKGENKKKERLPESAEMLKNNVEIKKSENNCKRADETQAASENFYRSVFENTSTATVILEEDGTILLANGAFENLVGYTREEVEGKKKWIDFISRKDELERIKEYHSLRRTDPPSAPPSYEFRYVDREGLVKDILVTVTPISDKKQSLVTLSDISEHRRLEVALRESERRFADIIDFLPDATFAIDLDGKIIAWNHAIEEMAGVKAEEMLGKGNHEYTIPFHGKRMPALIDLVLGLAEETEIKYDFIKREGDVLVAEVNMSVRVPPLTLWGKARPLYDSHGNVAGAIESIRNITAIKQAQEALQKAHDELEIKVRERTAELVQANRAQQTEISQRKRAESVLKESEEKYNQFFKTSRDCAFIASNDGSWIDLNDAAVELFGYSSREELMQLKIPNLYVNERERAKFIIIAESGYVREFPVDVRRKDGSVRHTLVTSVPWYNADGHLLGFQGTIRDITEQRRVDEELRKYREELEVLVSERTNELESRTKKLKEVNTALNVLLQKREEDKNILEERFVANIRSLVLSYVEMIRKDNLDEQQQFCLDIVEKNLKEIISPLLKNIQQFDLTPREVQVVSLIKDGMTTKEITKTLGIEKSSIDTHRRNIRKKLGLNRTSNLQSRLRFLDK